MDGHEHCFHPIRHGKFYLEVCCECGEVKVGFSVKEKSVSRRAAEKGQLFSIKPGLMSPENREALNKILIGEGANESLEVQKS